MKYTMVVLISFLLSVSFVAGVVPQVSSVDYQHRLLEIDAGATSATLTKTPSPSLSVSHSSSSASHWAVIVGISDYKAISDLNFCDDDANDWYAYLYGLGYEHIIVLGDNSSSYLQYDGLATESNVKQALWYVVTRARTHDTIVFVSSGHGSGDSRGASLLCMWDTSAGEDGEDGSLWDYELASILQYAICEHIFVFLDHCFSGGFGDDLMAMPNAAAVYVAVTCDVMGMGWDSSEYSNGLWTYYFLEYTLIGVFNSDPQTSMEDAFKVAESVYPYRGGAHHPQEYDGDPDALFYLW